MKDDDLIHSLLSNWLVQAIISAAISWLFNKLIDPSPPSHAVRSVAAPHSVKEGATPDDVRRAVEDALRRQKRQSGSSDDQNLAMLFVIFPVGVIVFLLMRYGLVVIDWVRWLPFLTGFSAALSLFRGYRSGLFQERQWIVRTIVILIICGLSYTAADVTRYNMEAILSQYQISDFKFNTFKEFFNVFGWQGFYYVMGLFFDIAVSAFCLLAQINMVLSAHLAQDMSPNWRMTLLQTMGDWWASATNLTVMLIFSGGSLALASGWLRGILHY